MSRSIAVQLEEWCSGVDGQAAAELNTEESKWILAELRVIKHMHSKFVLHGEVRPSEFWNCNNVIVAKQVTYAHTFGDVPEGSGLIGKGTGAIRDDAARGAYLAPELISPQFKVLIDTDGIEHHVPCPSWPPQATHSAQRQARTNAIAQFSDLNEGGPIHTFELADGAIDLWALGMSALVHLYALSQDALEQIISVTTVATATVADPACVNIGYLLVHPELGPTTKMAFLKALDDAYAARVALNRAHAHTQNQRAAIRHVLATMLVVAPERGTAADHHAALTAIFERQAKSFEELMEWHGSTEAVAPQALAACRATWNQALDGQPQAIQDGWDQVKTTCAQAAAMAENFAQALANCIEWTVGCPEGGRVHNIDGLSRCVNDAAMCPSQRRSLVGVEVPDLDDECEPENAQHLHYDRTSRNWEGNANDEHRVIAVNRCKCQVRRLRDNSEEHLANEQVIAPVRKFVRDCTQLAYNHDGLEANWFKAKDEFMFKKAGTSQVMTSYSRLREYYLCLWLFPWAPFHWLGGDNAPPEGVNSYSSCLFASDTDGVVKTALVYVAPAAFTLSGIALRTADGGTTSGDALADSLDANTHSSRAARRCKVTGQ
jgi:hypothetical protein